MKELFSRIDCFLKISGKWKIFTGNEIGIILGAWSWSQYKEKHPGVDPSNF